MWPFKRREPEGIPWGEFVETHLLPIAKAHGIRAREMSWEEATMDASEERAERNLVAAYDRNESQRTALMRIAEAATLEEAKAIAVGALIQFA